MNWSSNELILSQPRICQCLFASLMLMTSRPCPPACWIRVYTDVDHIGSIFEGTIDIDICSTFAGLFNRHWNFWESVPIFLHFSSWKCLKNEPFCVCVCVCVCVRVCVYIYQHMILHFSNVWFWVFCAFSPWSINIFSTFPSTFAGNPVDIRHRHLQTSESTSVYTLTAGLREFQAMLHACQEWSVRNRMNSIHKKQQWWLSLKSLPTKGPRWTTPT